MKSRGPRGCVGSERRSERSERSEHARTTRTTPRTTRTTPRTSRTTARSPPAPAGGGPGGGSGGPGGDYGGPGGGSGVPALGGSLHVSKVYPVEICPLSRSLKGARNGVNQIAGPRICTPLCGNEAHRCPAPSYIAQTPRKGAKTPKITKILSILNSGANRKKIPFSSL